MTNISLKIDISQGTVELDCAPQDLEAVISSAERVIAKLLSSPVSAPKRAEQLPPDPVAGQPEDIGEGEPEAVGSAGKPKAKRKKGGGHAKNWRVIDGLLTEEQRKQLKEFYSLKSPGSQNAQVAVLAYKLSELLGRESFDGDEIHTAFQAVGQRTPANLSGVFGNMAGQGLGRVVEKKWTPNFKSSDLVKYDLPATKKSK